MSPRTPPDQAHRDRAVAARGVNVLVDAGAGTGKTTLLVRRLVELVAPLDDGSALLLSRVAAVTFTRKAAGELRLRVRERLLSELARPGSPLRRERLARALAESDTAFIGTIHGFADRLLRMKPVEARLSPSYEIVEDADALCRETFELLLQAAEAGRLAEELAGTACGADRAAEAEEAIRTALAAEVRTESQELEFTTRSGLDALFSAFILHRDVPPPEAPPAPLALEQVRQRLGELRALAAASRGDGKGSRWMAGAAARLARLEQLTDPVALYREVAHLVRTAPRELAMRRDFPGDKAGWEAWKAWRADRTTAGSRDRITAPLHRWMATRLVRAFPAVVATYEQVKTRQRAVDQVDLLLRLRDLLRDRRDVRAELQGLFDHVFVDEFQDTDPLQAEIVLFLCEAGAGAAAWDQVGLAPGKLTLVGDPKQSIYRFRRADIAVYEAVRRIVAAGPHILVPLTANFRSEPALLAHLNARYDELLGAPAPGAPPFDAARGAVVNQHLDAGRAGRRQECVKVLPFASEEGKADPDRRLEALVTATWLRAAVEGGRERVVDPATGLERRLGFGDVAVLAHATSSVGLLLDALDRLGVPWSARGGKLFLQDPLHRQFLLALRAVADRDDGVAQAALLRPPFFALDLADLVRARAAGAAAMAPDAGIDRARAAGELVKELRRRRLQRPPGDTARDLLDRTGLGRAVALGPNGLQRLERLRELCFELERLAAAEGLDYDGATARLRAWALEPVGLDPPRPVGGEAVQVMTIHQAKGLEFPAVVWWDARATLAPRAGSTPWFVERTGGAWAMSLDGLACEEPEGSDLLARELAFQAAERQRLVYVAGTRARDLLVLPIAAGARADAVTAALRGERSKALQVVEAWVEGAPPAWAASVAPLPARRPQSAGPLAAEVEAAWAAAASEAAAPRLVPKGVAAEAHQAVEQQAEGEAGARAKERPGRFGAVFGETVHLAVGHALREPGLSPAEAVARAALATGLAAQRGEAALDVARALAALEREGLRRAPGGDLRLEYPVAAARGTALLSGYVDLLAERDGRLVVLDFKTDAPPEGEVLASHPAYVEQVRSYQRMLVELGLAAEGQVEGGLLFTADGRVRWV